MPEAFIGVLDTEKLRLARINFCFTRGEDFAMPFGRLDFLRLSGKRSPEPFHRLKALRCAQAGHFFFQFKNAHVVTIAIPLRVHKMIGDWSELGQHSHL